LAPCIVQHASDGRVLMMAWMNAEALRLTEATRFVHFFSRSRQRLWKKGETSGNTLEVQELRADCDRDTLYVAALPAGPACHTGAESCFFVQATTDDEDQGPPGGVLLRLDNTLAARRDGAGDPTSYTQTLFRKGMPKILEKIEEEQRELSEELANGTDARVISEAADLLFHVLVGLSKRGLQSRDVLSELQRRLGKSGLEEKASR